MAFDYIPLWDRYRELFEPLSMEERGRLVTAMQDYKDGRSPEVVGNERFVWPSIRRDIDTARAAYEETCRRQRENGLRGGRPKQGKEPDGFEEKPKNPPLFPETQKSKDKPSQGKSKQDKASHSPDGESDPPDGGTRPEEDKKAYGAFGWVRLTQREYSRLLHDLGEAEVKRCIAYVDESAQSTGNKNRWKDWNLVLRRCHRDGWGKQSGKQTAPAPKREDRQASAAALKQDVEWMEGVLAEARRVDTQGR